jgi:hypothetical protein
MQQAATANAFLRRLHPWIGRAVHARWARRRSLYQSEVDDILIALAAHRGPLPPELRLQLEGFLGRLHREWFPPTWRRNPSYAEVVADFRWWLSLVEHWQDRPARASRAPRRPKERLANQPKRLLRMLNLPAECTEKRFMVAWRRFLKRNHPDLNPDQTAEERRRFAEAVSLWRR